MTDLKKRTFWTRAGYGFTTLWIVFILWITDGDQENPWFDYIFLVPLAVWIIGLVVARLVGGKKGPEEP